MSVLNLTALGAVAAISWLGFTLNAFAAEIAFPKACTFFRVKHGSLGDTTLDYRVEAGTVFQQKEKDGVIAFCGPTQLHMSFLGWGPTDECVAINNRTIVDLPGSDFTVEHSNCAVENPFQIEYRPADFAAWQGQGISSLHGQAFLRTVGGDVKTCAGEFVYLIPGAPYFDQYLKMSAADLAQADPEAMAQLRRTVCDAQGNFSFKSVPAGKWYVLTSVTWGIPNIAAVSGQPSSSAGCIGRVSTELACAAVRGLLGALFESHPPPLTIEQGGLLVQPVELRSGENQTWLTDRDRK